MKRLVLVLGFVAFGVLAQAQSEGQPPEGGHRHPPPDPAKIAAFEAACAADRAQFCADAEGPHQSMRCLVTNEAQLSSGCAEKVEEFKAWRASHHPPRETAATAADAAN